MYLGANVSGQLDFANDPKEKKKDLRAKVNEDIKK